MKIIGLTGGIGSGKTFIAKIFIDNFNVPVYFSDDRAKFIMNNDPVVKKNIISTLGEESYNDGIINRFYISQKIFSDKTLIEKINNIVHPKVREDYHRWKENNKHNIYVIKETAILFESDSHLDCDFIITVICDLDTRIKRLVERDGTDRETIMNKIKNQYSDGYKITNSDFIINNSIGYEDKITDEIKKIHDKILSN